MEITTFGEYVSKTKMIFNCNFQHRDLHVHLHRPQLLLRHHRCHGEKNQIVSLKLAFLHTSISLFSPPEHLLDGHADRWQEEEEEVADGGAAAAPGGGGGGGGPVGPTHQGYKGEEEDNNSYILVSFEVIRQKKAAVC